MRHGTKRRLGVFLFSLSTLVLAAAPQPPDVSGDWEWNEQVIFVGPGEVVMSVFGIDESEGPVMRVLCETSGLMTLEQDGTSFQGDASQSVSCESAGGQVALHPPLPPSFRLAGEINGRSIHFVVGFDEAPITCPYDGSVSVQNDVATRINATGRCIFSAPFHPNMTKNVSFDATRL